MRRNPSAFELDEILKFDRVLRTSINGYDTHHCGVRSCIDTHEDVYIWPDISLSHWDFANRTGITHLVEFTINETKKIVLNSVTQRKIGKPEFQRIVLANDNIKKMLGNIQFWTSSELEI